MNKTNDKLMEKENEINELNQKLMESNIINTELKK